MKSLLAIWLLVLLGIVGTIAAFNMVTVPAGAATDSKLDSACQPSDTAGRCADKCSPGEYQQGNNKDTGEAVCVQAPSLPTAPLQPNVTVTVPGFRGK